MFADYADLHLALPDDRTMLLARGEENSGHNSLKEMRDRLLDGRGPPRRVADMLAETGPIDFMVARSLQTDGIEQGDQPIAPPTFPAFAGAVN